MPFPNKKCLNQVNTCYWFSAWVHDILHTSSADPPLGKVFQSFCKICSFLKTPFSKESGKTRGKQFCLLWSQIFACSFRHQMVFIFPLPHLSTLLCCVWSRDYIYVKKNLLALHYSTHHSVNIMSNISTCTSIVAIFTTYHENVSEL